MITQSLITILKFIWCRDADTAAELVLVFSHWLDADHLRMLASYFTRSADDLEFNQR